MGCGSYEREMIGVRLRAAVPRLAQVRHGRSSPLRQDRTTLAAGALEGHGRNLGEDGPTISGRSNADDV